VTSLRTSRALANRISRMVHASAVEEILRPTRPGTAGASLTLRIAVLDRDSGFLAVLGKRLERAGWEYRVLASSVAPRRSCRCAWARSSSTWR
jgi:hypothetical protein